VVVVLVPLVTYILMRFYEPIPKETAEIELLEYEPEYKPKQSRLSCQIVLNKKHNGLIATLLKDL